MDDELGSTAAALAESSATQRKWASFVLLGPLMPSLMAVIIVVIGGAIVKVFGRLVWNLERKSAALTEACLTQRETPLATPYLCDPVPRSRY